MCVAVLAAKMNMHTSGERTLLCIVKEKDVKHETWKSYNVGEMEGALQCTQS